LPEDSSLRCSSAHSEIRKGRRKAREVMAIEIGGLSSESAIFGMKSVYRKRGKSGKKK